MSIQEQITEDEIIFMEHFHDPTSLTENLIPFPIESPQRWPNGDRLFLRNYQFAIQNYSYMIADDPDLTARENFKRKKWSGDCYSIAARLLGKSWWTMIDTVLSIIHNMKQIALCAANDKKLDKVFTVIAKYFDDHKFCKVFELRNKRIKSVKRGEVTIETEHGTTLYGINEQSDSPKPGDEYQGKHFLVRFFEEYSMASEKGEQQAIDAEEEVGHIERPSGIPNITMDSPLGKIIGNKDLKNWIWQVPQYIRADWNDDIEEDRATFYNGRNSAQFKLNVLAEPLEGAFGFWDMNRLRNGETPCVKKSGIVKSFELTQDTFRGFEEKLIIERPSGTETCYICGDTGTGSAPTEIIIIFYDGKKYHYTYNITLRRLVQKEQAEIYYWLYNKIGGAFIAIDSGGDAGATIEELKSLGIQTDHLLKVNFYDKIEIDFERDENENIVLDKIGDPVMKQEWVMEWAMQRLSKLLYSGEFQTPPDQKFLNQFAMIIAKQTKSGRMIYDSRGEDHLHQAFQCWAICQFVNEFKSMKNTQQSKRCWGVN
jgi:hypothetical protein